MTIPTCVNILIALKHFSYFVIFHCFSIRYLLSVNIVQLHLESIFVLHVVYLMIMTKGNTTVMAVVYVGEWAGVHI